MVKFQQGNLSDMDVIGCFVLASTENGINEIEFNRLIEERKAQVGEEIVRLREEVLPEMSKAEFAKQGMIYLLSRENNCSLVEASEIYEKLQQERDKRPEGDYAKIVESMKTPSYDSPKPKSKGEKLSDDLTVEWIHCCDVKLQSLKKKYQRR